MKLIYDNVTHKAENTPGVEFRFPDWKDAEAVEWVTQKEKGFFDDIVYALAKCGYVEGKTIFGAPYDFRKGPSEFQKSYFQKIVKFCFKFLTEENMDWFNRMQKLTEYAYESNNNVGVTYIAHSMGGRMLLQMLQKMPKTWKDKYVKRVISLAVPWGGSTQSIMALSVGYNPFPYIPPFIYVTNSHMKTIQETFSSIAWLIPSEDFWEPTEILAVLDGKNYTLENIDQFF